VIRLSQQTFLIIVPQLIPFMSDLLIEVLILSVSQAVISNGRMSG